MLWIDIETLPAIEKPDLESLEPPKTHKKPETIQQWREDNQDKVWREQALDSMAGRICCISYALSNGPTHCLGIWSMSEYEILRTLDEQAQSSMSRNKANVIQWGGFNHKSFDMNWIWHRAVKYGLPTLIDFIPRSRYDRNFFDVRDLWTGGDTYGKGTLYGIARYLGYPVCEDMDGGQVLDRYLAGDFETIEKYNRYDVELTRSIAHDFGKGNPPSKHRDFVRNYFPDWQFSTYEDRATKKVSNHA